MSTHRCTAGPICPFGPALQGAPKGFGVKRPVGLGGGAQRRFRHAPAAQGLACAGAGACGNHPERPGLARRPQRKKAFDSGGADEHRQRRKRGRSGLGGLIGLNQRVCLNGLCQALPGRMHRRLVGRWGDAQQGQRSGRHTQPLQLGHPLIGLRLGPRDQHARARQRHGVPVSRARWPGRPGNPARPASAVALPPAHPARWRPAWRRRLSKSGRSPQPPGCATAGGRAARRRPARR